MRRGGRAGGSQWHSPGHTSAGRRLAGDGHSTVRGPVGSPVSSCPSIRRARGRLAAARRGKRQPPPQWWSLGGPPRGDTWDVRAGGGGVGLTGRVKEGDDTRASRAGAPARRWAPPLASVACLRPWLLAGHALVVLLPPAHSALAAGVPGGRAGWWEVSLSGESLSHVHAHSQFYVMQPGDRCGDAMVDLAQRCAALSKLLRLGAVPHARVVRAGGLAASSVRPAR